LRWAKEGAWGKIFVHLDLTLKEREERKILLQEKKDREQNGENRLDSCRQQESEALWKQTEAGTGTDDSLHSRRGNNCLNMKHTWKCMYTNANSIIGKMDELRQAAL